MVFVFRSTSSPSHWSDLLGFSSSILFVGIFAYSIVPSHRSRNSTNSCLVRAPRIKLSAWAITLVLSQLSFVARHSRLLAAWAMPIEVLHPMQSRSR
eukprot:gene12187-biopygen16244